MPARELMRVGMHPALSIGDMHTRSISTACSQDSRRDKPWL